MLPSLYLQDMHIAFSSTLVTLEHVKMVGYKCNCRVATYKLIEPRIDILIRVSALRDLKDIVQDG